LVPDPPTKLSVATFGEGTTLVSKRTLLLAWTALAPVFLALCIWTIISCVAYLQAPAGYGGASIDASGKLVVGPKKPDHITPLLLSAVTVPLGIGVIVLLLLWKRAPGAGPNVQSRGRRRRERQG
jgi:hypothetical protein